MYSYSYSYYYLTYFIIITNNKIVFSVSLSTVLTEVDSLYLVMRSIPPELSTAGMERVGAGNRTLYGWKLECSQKGRNGNGNNNNPNKEVLNHEEEVSETKMEIIIALAKSYFECCFRL